MAELPHEMPEIELNEIVDEAAPDTLSPVTPTTPLPTMAAKPPLPPVAPTAQATASPAAPAEMQVEIDIDMGDLAPPPVVQTAAPAAIPVAARPATPAATQTLVAPEPPVLPVDLTGAEPPPVSAPNRLPPPSVPSLDIDALFSDLPNDAELTEPNPGATVLTGMEKADEKSSLVPETAESATELAGENTALELELEGDTPAETAPVLPPLENEPPPISNISIESLRPDANTVETLKRLAGAAADPDRARAALQAALAGETYNARELPEPRAIALGLARLLTQKGFSADEIVTAVLDALLA